MTPFGFISLYIITLESLPRVYSDHDTDNLLFNDLKLINTVANMPDIIINTADKNLGFTNNHLDWYKQEYKRQLSDNDVYEKLPLEPLSNILSLGKNDLLLLHNKYANNVNLSGYKLTILKNRLQTEIKLPTLNIMPKVHKLKAKRKNMCVSCYI